jgi:hypothetical protein
MDSHSQLKVICFDCNLHFILCTERPETHHAKTLHCPECGQREGRFFLWLDVVSEPIFAVVPGATPIADVSEVITLPLGQLATSDKKKPN